MWSQRALPCPDFLIQGEGLYLDSTHNKSTGLTSSTNSAAGWHGGGSTGGFPTRSYFQTKIDEKMMKQSKDQLCLEILGKSNNGIENGVIEEGAAKSRQTEEFSSGEKLSSLSWGSGRDNVLLDNIVEKRDQELFQECSEHLDAINQSTQLQQVINNEMRSQAELDRLVFDSLKAKTERLKKQDGFSPGDADRSWISTAFNDLRKCVRDRAHAHRVYSETLINQSTAIQQHLDSHKNLMEKTKQSQPFLEPAAKADGKVGSASSASSPASMSFVEATCVFERMRKPRLKLISELDYLSTQVESLDVQLRDVESLLASIKQSKDAGQSKWRFQAKMEEARTRQEFLNNRRSELQGELKAVRSELKYFHLNHRDKMVVVGNVFKQHRVRCDSTLRKSFSLLCAASQNDQDVLKTLGAHKRNWLSPERTKPTGGRTSSPPDQTCCNNSESSGKDEGASFPSGGVLKQEPTQNRNPLKSRKVCFGSTLYSDGDLQYRSGGVENGNHSAAGDETNSQVLTEVGSGWRASSARESTPPLKKGSQPNFSSFEDEDENSPRLTPRHCKSHKENEGSFQGNSSPPLEVEGASCERKSQAACSEGSCKSKKGTGNREKNSRSRGIEIKERSEEGNTRQRLAPKAKNAQETSELSAMAAGGKGRSHLTRDSRSKVTSQDSVRDAKHKYSSTRPGTASPLGFKAREDKSDTTETLFMGDNLAIKPIQTSIYMSSETRSKQEPIKTLVQGLSSSSDRTDNFPTGQVIGHDAGYRESSSGSDSEDSDRPKSGRQGREETPRDRRHKSRQSSDGRTRVKTHDQSNFATHMSKSRETTASSDVGRRRVAFSDREASSSQRREAASRLSSASVSQSGAASRHERGILKKPSDSNRSLKTVLVRDDSEISNPVTLDQRSQACEEDGRSAPPSDTSRPQRGVSQAQDAFIPVVSESCQSRCSSSSSSSSAASSGDRRKGKDDPWLVEKMEQLERESVKLNNFMKEQKRMLAEEDRMNHLISKYANNRRGLSGLSKNFNNSEAAAPSFEDLSGEDVARGIDGTTEDSGTTDRLEFDADSRLHIDSGGNVRGSLGENPRQFKICTVHPISTDPLELNQNFAAREDHGTRDTEQDGDKQQLDGAHSAYLTQFEVTAGRFVVCSGKTASGEDASGWLKDQEEERESAPQQGEQHSKRVRCEWSAQRYNDSQTDVNNNLSSSDTAAAIMVGEEREVPPRYLLVPLEVVGRDARIESPARDVICDSDRPLVNVQVSDWTSLSPTRMLPAHHQVQGSKYSRCYSLSKALLGYHNNPSLLDRFRFTGTTSSCLGHMQDQDFFKRTTEYKVTDRPWLHDTGYECYSQEEKILLPDPKLLCVDSGMSEPQTDKQGEGKPLKSCLKKRMFDNSRATEETCMFIEAKSRSQIRMCEGAVTQQESEENYSDRQPDTEASPSTEPSQTLTQRAWQESSPASCTYKASRKVTSKHPKRVQFQESAQIGACEERWFEDSTGRCVLQHDARNLNLSNNSNTRDSVVYRDRTARGVGNKLIWSRSSGPATERSVMCLLLKESTIGNFFTRTPTGTHFNDATQRDIRVLSKFDLRYHPVCCRRKLEQRINTSLVIYVVISRGK